MKHVIYVGVWFISSPPPPQHSVDKLSIWEQHQKEIIMKCLK